MSTMSLHRGQNRSTGSPSAHRPRSEQDAPPPRTVPTVIRPAGRTAVRGGPAGGRLALRETVGQGPAACRRRPAGQVAESDPHRHPSRSVDGESIGRTAGHCQRLSERLRKSLPDKAPTNGLLTLATTCIKRSANGAFEDVLSRSVKPMPIVPGDFRIMAPWLARIRGWSTQTQGHWIVIAAAFWLLRIGPGVREAADRPRRGFRKLLTRRNSRCNTPIHSDRCDPASGGFRLVSPPTTHTSGPDWLPPHTGARPGRQKEHR